MEHGPRRFGAYDAVLLRDGVFEAPADALVHVDGEGARQQAIAAWGQPSLRMDVNCFALRGPSGVILVDAGTGPSWGAHLGHARAALADIGVAPREVGRVLLTHVHGDHALGLFDGEAPYFPEAEILVPQADLAFFTDAEARAAIPKARQGGFDIAAALLRVYAGRVRPIAPGPVMPGIEACPLPGHTPGHTGYLVGDGADRLLLWADMLHLEALQPADPDIGLVYDLDPAAAARTRRGALEQAARQGWSVAGGHVSGFGRVEAVGGAYRIMPD